MQAASCMASEPGCPCQLENPISFYEEGHLGFPQNPISLHGHPIPVLWKMPRAGAALAAGRAESPTGSPATAPSLLCHAAFQKGHPRHCPHHLAGLSITKPSKARKYFFRGSRIPQPRLPAINPTAEVSGKRCRAAGKSQACVNKATTPPDLCSSPKILSTDCWEASAHSLMETEQKGAVIC